MQFVVGHSVLASFRLIRLHSEKIRKVEMLIGLHLKCCSTVIYTISGEADVVKTITSHDKPTIERFSFTFTANGKRQAAACRKSKKIILF